jgi:hypothetical protein
MSDYLTRLKAPKRENYAPIETAKGAKTGFCSFCSAPAGTFSEKSPAPDRSAAAGDSVQEAATPPNSALTPEGAPGLLSSTPSENAPQSRGLDRLAAVPTISLTLRRKSLSRYGYRYEVVLDGEVIVSASRDPEFDACRELVKRGLSGKAVFCREGRPSLVVDIERGAELTTKEGAHGVRFVKFTLDNGSTG